MASNNVYEIRIRYDADTQDPGDSPIAGSGGGKGPSTPGQPAGGKNMATAGAGKIIRPFIDAGLTMRTDYIATVTGSAQLAQRNRLFNSTASAAADLAISSATGAGLAAALGFSNPVGAVIGVTIGAVNKALDIATKAYALSTKKTVEDTAISAGTARAGISWNMSRRK